MGYSRFDPAIQARAAWNAGKTVGTRRPLTQKQIWAIRFHLDREGRLRDKALFDLAIDSKLRGCDLVKVKIGDVVAGADIRNRKRPVETVVGNGQFRDAGGGTGMTDCGCIVLKKSAARFGQQ